MTDYERLAKVSRRFHMAQFKLDRIRAKLGTRSAWNTDSVIGRGNTASCEDRLVIMLDLKREAEAALERLAAERNALRASARREIEALPDGLAKQAITLRYLDERSIRAIAVILSVCERQVYVLLDKAKIGIYREESRRSELRADDASPPRRISDPKP